MYVGDNWGGRREKRTKLMGQRNIQKFGQHEEQQIVKDQQIEVYEQLPVLIMVGGRKSNMGIQKQVGVMSGAAARTGDLEE